MIFSLRYKQDALPSHFDKLEKEIVRALNERLGCDPEVSIPDIGDILSMVVKFDRAVKGDRFNAVLDDTFIKQGRHVANIAWSTFTEDVSV